jgi:hypothetical protein
LSGSREHGITPLSSRPVLKPRFGGAFFRSRLPDQPDSASAKHQIAIAPIVLISSAGVPQKDPARESNHKAGPRSVNAAGLTRQNLQPSSAECVPRPLGFVPKHK